MLMKNKNIVVEVPENKIKEYEEKGYNKYKKEDVLKIKKVKKNML